jgi:hypothetical protein
MKLVSIVKSPRAGKKWRATFDHDGTIFHTDFGASGYLDYTQSKDPKRAELYRARHKKDLLTNNPTKPGYLSWYILWLTPNFEENVRRYKNKFHL